jgi:hypothetical protein
LRALCFDFGSLAQITRKSTPGDPNLAFPCAHTCFFQIDLPAYTDKKKARDKILYAITYCRSIDADEGYSGGREAMSLGWGEDDDDDGL